VTHILGISAFYHDSAAALISDGEIVAAAQEERFTRTKHDPSFPKQSIDFCLKQKGIRISDLDAIVFYEKPFIKMERVLETHLAEAPRSFWPFVRKMPGFLQHTLFLKSTLKKQLVEMNKTSQGIPPLYFSEHHLSHAASAFFPSPFEKAAILCVDGVGEWATTSAWVGEGSNISPLWEIPFPHSLGLIYSAFTSYVGLKVNSAEYKLMGLAPYGEPQWVSKIKDHLIDIKEDGSYRLNMDYFSYCYSERITSDRFHSLFGDDPRPLGSEPTLREMNLAASIQKVLEEVLIRMGRTLQRETGLKKLCMAGGVALNCVANSLILKETPFENIWVAPASGDAGGALGAAFVHWHQYMKKERIVDPEDSMKASLLGPSYSVQDIQTTLTSKKASFDQLESEELMQKVADSLSSGQVVGWFSGAMEYGPRALGARSILADAREPEMQKKLNLKIKFRESFRPFAPIVLEEDRSQYFEGDRPSPYMLFTEKVKNDKRVSVTAEQEKLEGIERLNLVRSSIPAVTHVDNSARLQTVNKNKNPRLHRLLEIFKKQTGDSVLVNTSFNVRGEPIVCSPEDAYNCFMATDMDVLVLEDFILYKNQQIPSVLPREERGFAPD
jgi:carbamoyltransferase